MEVLKRTFTKKLFSYDYLVSWFSCSLFWLHRKLGSRCPGWLWFHCRRVLYNHTWTLPIVLRLIWQQARYIVYRWTHLIILVLSFLSFPSLQTRLVVAVSICNWCRCASFRNISEGETILKKATTATFVSWKFSEDRIRCEEQHYWRLQCHVSWWKPGANLETRRMNPNAKFYLFAIVFLMKTH